MTSSGDPRLVSSGESKPEVRSAEFVALAAFMMAMFGMSIDAILPALSAIRVDLASGNGNQAQLIVTVMIVGMALGQPIYGPVSDAIGRKPAIYIGLSLFAAGCAVSIAASDLPTMFIGRFLQGLGVAGPRVVMLAIVRDQYEGKAMARVMSWAVALMMIGVMVAPLIGALVLRLAQWRAIFGALIGVDAVAFIWLALRQPETLCPSRRTKLSWQRSLSSAREVCTTRSAIGYSVASGLALGMLFGWVSSAPQIFSEIYAREDEFPAIFAALAPAIVFGSLVNGRFVTHLPMTRICEAAVTAIVAVSCVTFVAYPSDAAPPLLITIGYVATMLFFLGLQFGNLNTLAMSRLAHIAGTAAGVSGSIGWLLGATSGAVIGQGYDGTIRSMVAGFGVLGAASLITMRWARLPTRTKLSQRPSR